MSEVPLYVLSDEFSMRMSHPVSKDRLVTCSHHVARQSQDSHTTRQETVVTSQSRDCLKRQIVVRTASIARMSATHTSIFTSSECETPPTPSQIRDIIYQAPSQYPLCGLGRQVKGDAPCLHPSDAETALARRRMNPPVFLFHYLLLNPVLLNP